MDTTNPCLRKMRDPHPKNVCLPFNPKNDNNHQQKKNKKRSQKRTKNAHKKEGKKSREIRKNVMIDNILSMKMK